MLPEQEPLRAAIRRLDETIREVRRRRRRLVQRARLLECLKEMPSQRPGLSISFQGGRGSWSDRSLSQNLPWADGLACDTVADAWRHVLEGDSAATWLPSYNSTIGVIEDVLPVLDVAVLWLEAEVEVRHVLSAPENLPDHAITKILGHPRALDQCAHQLQARWPHAEQVATVDGPHSASHGLAGGPFAVLGPPLAPELGWRVADHDVCDVQHNWTRFALLVPRDRP